jgi:hypothetical protein
MYLTSAQSSATSEIAYPQWDLLRSHSDAAANPNAVMGPHKRLKLRMRLANSIVGIKLNGHNIICSS